MNDQTQHTSLPGLYQRVLEVNEDTTHDHIRHMQDAVEAAVARVAEVRTVWTQALIEWINANGDLVVGDIRYYVGTSKTTKCIDKGQTLFNILDAAAGDLDSVARCLSANAWKPGECRGILKGELWDENFTVEPVMDLKTGKPKKQVNRVDSKFLTRKKM